MQLWVALPDSHRHIAPAFQNIAEVPRLELRGGIAQVFMGDTSPADTYSDIIGIDLQLHPGATLELPADAAREHGLFLLEGDAQFESQPLVRNMLHYLGTGRTTLPFRSAKGARLLLLGGHPFGEPVLMWWNFVARTPEEIAEARNAWEEGRFGIVRGYDGPALPAPPLTRLARPNPAS